MEKHERLRASRIRAGFQSATDAANAIGVKVPTYTSHENGTRDFDDEYAKKYARRLGVNVEWLVFERGENTPIKNETEMPVRGEVRAGAWLEIDENPPDMGTIPAMHDPRFTRATQFALLVVGTSMNKVVPPGQYVIVASWPELGQELRDGDLVVVRRERAMTYEVTLKRARVGTNGKWQLWPESTDPRYQEPVTMGDGDRDVEVTVIGKVVGRYEQL